MRYLWREAPTLKVESNNNVSLFMYLFVCLCISLLAKDFPPCGERCCDYEGIFAACSGFWH
jgi:hypothetical protein